MCRGRLFGSVLAQLADLFIQAGQNAVCLSG